MLQATEGRSRGSLRAAGGVVATAELEGQGVLEEVRCCSNPANKHMEDQLRSCDGSYLHGLTEQEEQSGIDCI